MNNLIFGHQVTERNLKSPSLIHCRIASLLKSLILVLIIRSYEHILFKNGKSRLTWRVRCRRLRRLIWSPMRIALRGKVPTLPYKKVSLTLKTLLDQENNIPNHSQLRVHCFLFHSKPEKRFFSGEWWS